MTTPDRVKVQERGEKGGDCSLNLRLRSDSVTWGEMDVSCTGQNNLHDLNCTSPLCMQELQQQVEREPFVKCNGNRNIFCICVELLKVTECLGTAVCVTLDPGLCLNV